MKRFILILAVMMLTGLGANAAYYQSVGGLGRPTHMMTPTGMRSINNFGANAAFLPQNRRAASMAIRMRENRRYAQTHGADRYARPYGYYNDYYMGNNYYNGGSPKPAERSVQVSRFDKNYRITSSRKPYTQNGVTYFE